MPLNGYFDNRIRAATVKRGVVAQAIAHLASGKKGLDQSIQFLLDTYISSGLNPQYEDRNLQKFYGVTNNMTRAQVVTMLYRMDERNYYEISADAQAIHENANNVSLMTRAKMPKVSSINLCNKQHLVKVLGKVSIRIITNGVKVQTILTAAMPSFRTLQVTASLLL